MKSLYFGVSIAPLIWHAAAHSQPVRGGSCVADQMRRCVRWWREGYLSSIGACFDIGGTTRAALTRFEQTGGPYAGSTDPNAVGNGSLMRLAPMPLFYAADPALVVGGRLRRPDSMPSG